MNDFKRKRAFTQTALFSLCTGILCCTSAAHGDTFLSYESDDDMISAKSKTCTKSSPKPAAYDADLFKKDKPAYFFNAEYLAWFVNEGALDFAVKMDQQAFSPNSYAVGNYQNAEFDWASGFRVALGYYRAPSRWDMFMQYTYVPSFGSKTVHAPDEAGEFLNGTWAQPDLDSSASAIPLEKAKSRISFKYNVFDFLASRRFYPNDHLRMNLFGGITSAFLYHTWNVRYEDIADQHTKIRNRWKFEGLGLRLGLRLDWYLGWDLYLTGLASSGILTGWYKNSAYQKTDAAIAGADTSLPIRDGHFSDTRLTYTTQFMSGFSWQKAFESVRTELTLGYEFNIWTNLHQIYRSSFAGAPAAKETFINDSQVSLQGFTARFNIDF